MARSMRLYGQLSPVRWLSSSGSDCAFSTTSLRAWKAGSKLSAAAVLVYFLIHEFRDEFFFYDSYGEAADQRSGRETLALLLALVPVGLAAAWSAQFVFPEGRDLSFVEAHMHSTISLLWWWALPVAALLAVSILCTRRLTRTRRTTVRAMVSRNRPIWIVYGGILVVIALAAPFGGKFYSIILLHIAAWWVFASARLARFGRPEGLRRLGLRTWLRRSQAGFQTLHVGADASVSRPSARPTSRTRGSCRKRALGGR